MGDGPVGFAKWSPDGKKLAIAISAVNLAPDTENRWNQLYVKDFETGAISLLTQSNDGTVGNANQFAPYDIFWSPNGKGIAFTSNATNLVPGAGSYAYDLGYVRSTVTGTLVVATSSTDGTPANDFSVAGEWSPDSKLILMWSEASNLVPGASGTQIYAKTLNLG